MTDKLNIRPLGFPWETKDPFIFCVHHRDEYPKGNENLGPAVSLAGRNIGQDFTVKDGWRMYHGQTVPGFPYHPHRGFETVTVVKEGVVDHTDSLGAAGRFSSGDVQWMTAGKGVLHSEMFPLLNQDKENPMELFQIWLNLPKKSKFVDPHFKMLWADAIPVVLEKDANGRQTEITIVAGTYKNNYAPAPTPDSWASDPKNEVAIWTLKLEAQAEWTLPASTPGLNSRLYFYRGDTLSINDQKVPNYYSIEIQSEQSYHLKAGDQTCFLLLLQGNPINEPVVQHGPFVMNTAEEIQEAFQEYRQTQFGGWPWPQQEQTHGKDKERFALHANGRLEKSDSF